MHLAAEWQKHVNVKRGHSLELIFRETHPESTDSRVSIAPQSSFASTGTGVIHALGRRRVFVRETLSKLKAGEKRMAKREAAIMDEVKISFSKITRS